jgi:hypothetical protein
LGYAPSRGGLGPAGLPHWGAALPAGRRAVVRPGPGRTKKKIGASSWALAAGFSEMGSVAARTV